MNHYYIFADSAYGSGSYDNATYNGTTSSSTGTGSTSGSGTPATGGATGSGVLTDTGFDIALAATLACAIIFAALLVRFWKRPATEREETKN